MPDNAELVRSLRDFADYLEAHPSLCFYGEHRFDVWLHNKDQMAAVAREHAPIEKIGDHDDLFILRKRFGRIRLDWNVAREAVCRKVVVGRKEVVMPAQEAQPERTEIVEETKWVCDEPLLSSNGHAADEADEAPTVQAAPVS